MHQIVQAKKTTLFYPTTQKDDVLEHLARHELLTVNHLVYLIYGTITDEAKLRVAQASLRRTLRILREDGYLHSTYFRPPGFKGKGKYPGAFWLSDEGEDWARVNYPLTDPKSHGIDRADINILHDLIRSDLRIKLYELAKKNGLDIACQKNNLSHGIKPDDLYKIRRTKTAHFFMEGENKKKDYGEIYEDKLKGYLEIYGTPEAKDLFGSRYFSVLLPFKRIEGMKNLLTHLRGGCNCLDPNARKLHKDGPYKLHEHRDIFLFTTYDAMMKDPGGKIFETPSGTILSLLDIIQ